VAYHANIKDSQFNVGWFRSFTLAFNALDNVEARRHVNKMCLAADIPLIDAGTTGFQGQVQVIKKGVTACYDCTARPVPRTFPVCTIRSTPSQPIHCIVWGKSYLLNEMFGASEDESAFDHSADEENKTEIEELKRESAALKKIRQAIGTPQFPQMLFDKVFKTDILRLRSMEDVWKNRRPPEPLDFETLHAQATEALAHTKDVVKDDQKIWSLEENLAVYINSLIRLSQRVLRAREAGEEDMITFDKDDEDTLDFVAASANFRASLFGIECKSKFDIKQMAGNIIPAIATTNAIVAGLCVLQAFKVLRGEFDTVKEVFLTPFNTSRLLAADKLRQPNPDCPICSVFQLSIRVDLGRATLRDVVNFIRGDLDFDEREFVLNNEVGILYDADEIDNLDKKLGDLGIGEGSFLTIADEDEDDPFVNVVLNIEAHQADEAGERPVIPVQDEVAEIPRKPKSLPVLALMNGVNGKHARDEDDDVVVAQPPLKRSAPNTGEPNGEGGESITAKRAKVAAFPTPDDDDVVVIEDTNGAILIDDN
jgi:ubiquitin-like 1-activating enzyme E1 B